jgi:hypothetical protein
MPKSLRENGSGYAVGRRLSVSIASRSLSKATSPVGMVRARDSRQKTGEMQ